MTKEDLVKENTGEKIKVYEVGYLLLPIIEESNIQTEANNIREIIEKNKGMFLSEEAPQMRGLTYSMTKAISGKKQKFDEAYFGWIKFEGYAENMKDIKESLDKSESILRYILINAIKENITIANSKVAKFSFDKESSNKEEKKEKAVDETEEKIDKKEENKEEVPEDKLNPSDGQDEEGKISGKKLDDTIDDLVIE